MDTFGRGGFVATYLAADYSASPHWLPVLQQWVQTYRRPPFPKFR